MMFIDHFARYRLVDLSYLFVFVLVAVAAKIIASSQWHNSGVAHVFGGFTVLTFQLRVREKKKSKINGGRTSAEYENVSQS